MVSGFLIAVVAAPLALYLFLLAAWHLLRRYLIARSGINDLKYLNGHGRKDGERFKGTAVICGGSITGLITARVCHDFFERVLIIEPEAWVGTPDGLIEKAWEHKNSRGRVMQWNSLHACQGFVYRGLCALLPNFTQEATKSGINILPGDFGYTFSGALSIIPWKKYGKDKPMTLYTSRPGFETLIRRLVLNKKNFPRIEQMAGTVTGIIPDPNNKSRIGKVAVRTEEGNEEVDAMLVADCTGITRAGLKWLERAGYGYGDKYSKNNLPLNEIRIAFDQKLYYSTFMFDLTPDEMDTLAVPGGLRNAGHIATYLEAAPGESPKFLLMMKPDGDRVMLFGGHCGDHLEAPRTVNDLRELTKSLVLDTPVPGYIFKLFDQLEHHGPDTMHVSTVRVPGTAYLRYHLGTNLPANFIVLGDAEMSVNPRYGQGATKAVFGVIGLHNVLRGEEGSVLSPGFAKHFFREQFEKTDAFWQSTRALDYGCPETEPIPGESLAEGEFLRKYLWQIQLMSTTDPDCGALIYESTQAINTPIDMFHPNLAIKVFRRMILGF
ncbi:hypothetical protein FISHEDRAFT_42132 [Fistulina hepatica ATCC 64428]|uniref:FAD/NAD(P)-binding domain-containing protein n=1 Tax=Fistulina hepatica ATCC 64428 TaxID=1128425 RepID=A0A0D7AGM6_9AGAR|nr:hypothetical protein FISHEDRAFT_42132 [Fistulina hepatica ATCC 64428]